MAEAQPIHIPSLTIQHYPKTAEGQAIIGSQQVFCIGGKLYQGFKGTIATVFEVQLSEDELVAVYDADGSLDKVLAQRKARNASHQYRKDEELVKRQNVKKDQRRKDLELAKLEQELATGTPQSNSSDPEPPIAAQSPVCDLCDKHPPSGHKNPFAWLTGHKMGAHKVKNK